MKISAYLSTQAGQRDVYWWDGGHSVLSTGLSGVVAEGAQVVRKPPSTGRAQPVVMLHRSLSRKRMVFTTSSTSVGSMRSGAKMKEDEGKVDLILQPQPIPQAQASPRPAGTVPSLDSSLAYQRTCQVGCDPA